MWQASLFSSDAKHRPGRAKMMRRENARIRFMQSCICDLLGTFQIVTSPDHYGCMVG
jgi:hypothetical protein